MPQRTVPTICLTILTIFVVFAVHHQAKDIFAPIVASLLLGIVPTPLSDFWDRLRVPPALAAFISVALAILTILIFVLAIEPYVTQVFSQAPVIRDELRSSIFELKRMLRGVEQMTDDVAQAIEPAGSDSERGAVAMPSVTDALFVAPQFAAQFLIFTGTLYFFLMSRNAIYEWTSKTFKRFGEDELRDAGKQVSRYVLTITAINLCFGVSWPLL
ncbi:uncharacterized protein DUF20 [Yoonia sediminilitoris]|uniref:Uncharacterized protein DUF20 n=1 Tax=Yoonia sediminilitoris TaxID=1286148 RepID=A0A2T6KHC7_9RHOB|nr:uncharacterized protein DUF20 [Yoonia sediminilitoris]RCW95643.1 uncharacterized protein DUF20 [Yoonia sediminilitoris]